MILPAPNLLGAPSHYNLWRRNQAEAVLSAIDCSKRCIVRGAPTGFGKTLMYVMWAILSDRRTCILTSTKAQQKQVIELFAESGLVEIRGLNSYECVEGVPTGRFGDYKREGYRADQGMAMTCEEAPCQSGAFCRKREGGCLYYDAFNRANLAPLVITNYAYWMSINKFGEGLGDFDALVLDEAHNAIDELGKFVGTEIRPAEIEAVLPRSTAMPNFECQTDVGLWRAWGNKWSVIAAAEIEYIKAEIRANERGEAEDRTGKRVKVNHTLLRKARDLKRVQQKLITIGSMNKDWVIERVEDNKHIPSIKFDPVWPGEYAEEALFLRIPKVFMVSATVRPRTAEMMNVAKEDIDFAEYPSTFKKENRPVIFVPTAHMNMKSASLDKSEWHNRMDQIIERRPTYKGIIHTVSYPRAREIYRSSKNKMRLLMHDSDNTKEIIEQFKRSTEPLVLVSPVLDTGYDFPHDQCRFQIVAKMPFPVTVDKVIKARMLRDTGYRDYLTMVKLVQMAGRIVRAENDWGETFIIDSDFLWWYNKVGRKLSPHWFTESVRYEGTLGMPLTCAA